MDLQSLKNGVPWIDIEGGPCAGKTTALASICEWCQEHGFTPIIVPEAATNLIGSGLNPTTTEFQEYVLREIVHAVTIRMNAIRDNNIKNPVLIFDSGFARGQAYVSKNSFEAALDTVGLSFMEARDVYDGVIFLDSAAVGAEKFYTTSNNKQRRETLEEAREINIKTHEAWIGTPHLKTIRNQEDQTFEMKIRECLKALARILGVPEPREIERKFLLHDFEPNLLPESAVPIDIVQTYLVNSGTGTERVRARGQNDRYFHFHTIKHFIQTGESAEQDRLIGAGMYDNLLIRRDTNKLPIHKTRRCLVHEGNYFEIDSFHAHQEGCNIFEVEVHDLSDEIIMPEYLGEFTEVTDDSAYTNYNMADVA